jgi:predicted small metal-binding protein
MSPLAVTLNQSDRLLADTAAGERPAATQERFATREPTQAEFRLRCADAHPVGCDVELVSSSRDDVVSRTCSHGASAHGFTPVWYSPRRLAAIAAKVAQTGRARATGKRP